MSEEVLDLLKQALALSEEERAELAGNLIESLDSAVDEDVETAWQQEVARRAADIQSGKTKPMPWQEVQQKARRLLDDEWAG